MDNAERLRPPRMPSAAYSRPAMDGGGGEASGRARWIPTLWYAALALLIAAPLMRGGSLLLLDFALVRHIEVVWWPSLSTPGPVNSAPIRAVLWVLVKLGYAAGPLIVFAIFLAMGLGMHRAVRVLVGAPRAAAVVAGTLYAVNPFVYERLMAGHLFLLSAYALAPFALVAAVRFVERPGARRAFVLTLFMAAITWFSLHAVVMTAVLLALIVGFRRRTWRRAVLGWGLAGIGVFLALNAWWIAGVFAVQPGSAVGTQDLAVYATQPRSDASIGNVAALYGFWRHEFALPKDGVQAWWLLALPFAALVVYGVVVGARDRRLRPLVLALATLIPIAALLAAGISFSPTAGVFRWLFEHVPGFKIFREPQKWVALLALAYAILGAVGLGRLLPRERVLRGLVVAVSLVAIVVYSNTLVWNWDRLRPVRFPAEWEQVDRIIASEGGGRVLFLPWHLYMSMSFTGYRAVNPAGAFFGGDVLSGDNLEVAGIETQSVDPESAVVEAALRGRDPEEFARALDELCVSWVVLAREDDFREYEWVGSGEGLEERFAGMRAVLWEAGACSPLVAS